MANDLSNNLNVPIASLVVATKSRPEDLRRFLQSLENSGHIDRQDVEVLIVDNTEGDPDVINLCHTFGVQHLTAPMGGKASALNIGILHARGRILVFSDDDVAVRDSDWIDAFVRAFADEVELGYVSGNVKAAHLQHEAQKLWEKKGGLSKGHTEFRVSPEFLKAHGPRVLSKFCVGANCAIPRSVINEIGGYNELFGPGAAVPHGESLEIGYRILNAGYYASYKPSIVVEHYHTAEMSQFRKKLFIYGLGDSAVPFHIFLEHIDWKALHWSLWGHPLYTLKKMWARLHGNYPMPCTLILLSLLGSALGVWLYLAKRTQIAKWQLRRRR